MREYKTEIKWGLIITASTLLWALLERSLGFHTTKIAQHSLFSYLYIIVAVALYYFALKEKMKTGSHKMDWRQGMISGIIIGLVVMILAPVTQAIIHQFISPEYFDNAIAQAVNAGYVSPDDAPKYFNLSSYMMQSMIIPMPFGTVVSSVIASFLRKKA